MTQDKQAMVGQLKKDILGWQGIPMPESQTEHLGLGMLEDAFPNGIFPKGSIHEFISSDWMESAASCGFIGIILSRLMGKEGVCIWINNIDIVFPIAFTAFDLDPARIIFVQLEKEKDILWAMEEALKCEGIAAVVAEVHRLDFVQSRRLQLAVEKSRVTGIVLRHNARVLGTTACAARWQVRSLKSELEEGMPGVGFPRWTVELLKVRNGNTGKWQFEWSPDGLLAVKDQNNGAAWAKKMRKLG